MTALCHNFFDTAIRCSEEIIRYSDKLIQYGADLYDATIHHLNAVIDQFASANSMRR